jgi:hypothetical protein
MTRTLRARKTRPLPTGNDASESGGEQPPMPLRKRAKRMKPEDKEEAEAGPSQPPARGKPRGRVGKLAQMPHMPLDILFDVCNALLSYVVLILTCLLIKIFSMLPPLDLLRLTRTNKTLRGLLMSRNARQTWIAALGTVPDCPPVPEGMTEPAWVRLAFENACHVCWFLLPICR